MRPVGLPPPRVLGPEPAPKPRVGVPAAGAIGITLDLAPPTVPVPPPAAVGIDLD